MLKKISTLVLIVMATINTYGRTYNDVSKDVTYAIKPTLPLQEATTAELADLEVVREYISNWFGGSSAPNISSATAFYNGLNITVNGSTITGNVPSPNAANNHVQNLARHYHHTKTESSLTMLKNIFWLMMENGYGVGDDWEYHPYQTREFLEGMALSLQYFDSDFKDRLWESQKYNFEMGQYWSDDWTHDYRIMSDYVYGWFRSILGIIANGSSDNNECVRWMKGFTNHLNTMNVPAKGTSGWIKPDGTGFHHMNHYNHYMYAFSKYADMLHALIGTQYQIGRESFESFRDMAYASTIMCHENTQYANSLSGRYPIDQISPMNKDAFEHLAEVEDDIDGVEPIMAKEYNRIYGDGSETVAAYGTRPFPTGFWQFNWSPIALYRKDSWVATAHGINSTFWGTESYSGENKLGRYQSYGSLEIMYGNFEESGFHLNGWDWNLPPGATTKYLPHSSLISPSRSDERAADGSDFAGALRFQEIEAGKVLDKGVIGMYGNDFTQHPPGNWYTSTHDNSFKFKKSFYFIDGYIVCLGSDIKCDDTDNNIVTSIFQGMLGNSSDPIVVNNTPITGFPYNNSSSSADTWMVDGYSTGYHFVSDNTLIINRKTQTSIREQGSGTTTGNFSTAYLDHGKAPTGGSYEYVVKPSTSSVEMNSFSQTIKDDKPYTVVQQNANAHIVKLRDSIEAYSLFTSNTNIQNTVLKGNTLPCMVMLQKVDEGRALNLTLVNPDIGLEAGQNNIYTPVITIQVTLNGQWYLVNADAGVSIVSSSDTETVISFDTKDAEPFDISLSSSYVPASSIDILADSVGLNINDTARLHYTINPAEATNQTVFWSSNNEDVASIDPSGIVTGIYPGTAMLYAVTDDGDFEDSCKITVLAPPCIFPNNLSDFSVSNQSISWTSGPMNIACATAVDISLDLEGTGALDHSDSLHVYYRVDGGAPQLISENQGALVLNTVSSIGISGSTLEIVIVASNNADGELYTISNISITNEDCIAEDEMSITPSSITLDDGITTTLTAVAIVDCALHDEVNWSSNDTSIATVNEFGVVTAQSPGTTTITATAEGASLSETCVVTVNTIDVTGVSVIPQSLTTCFGTDFELNVSVSPINATNDSLLWVSSDTSIVTINTNGLATTKDSAGSAVIYVTTVDGGFIDSSLVNVLSCVYDPLNLALNKSIEVSLESQQENPKARLVDGDLDVDNNRWAAQGMPQWAEIDLGAICNVTRTEMVCAWNRAYQFTVEAKVNPNDDYVRIVDRSSNTDAGMADDPILDFCVPTEARFVKITVTGAVESTSWVSLTEFSVFGTVIRELVPVDSVRLSVNELTIQSGSSEALMATVYPVDADDQSISWSTGDASIASVNSSGEVTAVSAGETTIYATGYQGVQDSCVVIVPVTLVTDVSVSPQVTELSIGEQITLTATLSPSNATNQNISWTSVNSSTATVDTEGRVEALEEGVTKIYVTSEDGGFTDTCVVTVTNPVSVLVAREGDWGKVYPNPFTSILKIKVTDISYTQAVLMDLSGRAISTVSIENGEAAFSPSYKEAPVGIYVVRLLGGEKELFIKVLRVL